MPPFVLYILLGIGVDCIIVIYYKAIASRQVWLASLLGFAITALTLLVIEGVVVSRNPLLLMAYALGTGIGTAIGVKTR